MDIVEIVEDMLDKGYHCSIVTTVIKGHNYGAVFYRIEDIDFKSLVWNDYSHASRMIDALRLAKMVALNSKKDR